MGIYRDGLGDNVEAKLTAQMCSGNPNMFVIPNWWPKILFSLLWVKVTLEPKAECVIHRKTLILEPAVFANRDCRLFPEKVNVLHLRRSNVTGGYKKCRHLCPRLLMLRVGVEMVDKFRVYAVPRDTRVCHTTLKFSVEAILAQ